MNLDELQTAQSRERQTDSLQQLRESFYEEAGRFISQLREERQRASEQADDPFDAPEVRRLTDDIKTAERTVEAIYERRIGKLVKQASLEAAGMAADASGLTKEEQDVFETLVSTIEHNRVRVLDEVVAGEVSSSVSTESPTRDSEPDPADTEDAADVVPDSPIEESSGVDAADLMGGADSGESSSAKEVPPERGDTSDSGPAIPPDTPLETDDDAADVTAPDEEPDYGADPTPSPDSSVEVDESDDESASDDHSQDDQPAIQRTTVRITRDVGEILGVDQRAYDLKNEDVVTLPTPNAEPLVDRDAAEKLE